MFSTHPHPRPLPGKPKNRGRGVLTAAREAGGLRFCPAPSQDTPSPRNCHPHSMLWGSRLEKWHSCLGLGPQALGGALYKNGGWGSPVPPKLGSCWKMLLKGGGLGGGAEAPEPLGQGATGKEEGPRSPLPPSFSAATQDEGPALPARAGRPLPGPGLTAPAPRPRPAPRPPAGFSSPRMR